MVTYAVNDISLTGIRPAPNTAHEQYAPDGTSGSECVETALSSGACRRSIYADRVERCLRRTRQSTDRRRVTTVSDYSFSVPPSDITGSGSREHNVEIVVTDYWSSPGTGSATVIGYDSPYRIHPRTLTSRR